MVQAAVYIRKKIKDEMLLSRAFGRDLVRYIFKFKALLKELLSTKMVSGLSQKKSVIAYSHRMRTETQRYRKRN